MIAKTRSTRKASTASESVDLAHKKDENCAKKAPRRIPTMKMSKTKLDASTTSSKSSPVIKSTANDRRVMPKRPTMNGQPTTQQRPTMEPRDELNRLRNEADQSQLLQDYERTKEELRFCVINLREVVDANSQLTKELHRTQAKLQQVEMKLREVEFAKHRGMEGLKAQNIRLQVGVEEWSNRVHPPHNTNLAQVDGKSIR
ncbi:hypothetical protein AC1031_013235 [Aphanomyces cochlioides]|nr:hypothetical protein AC1031_013235 [Aphanomyces cochlioides]